MLGEARAGDLAQRHAAQRRYEGQQRQAGDVEAEDAAGDEIAGERHGRDGEGDGERLDQQILPQIQRLQVGHGRDNEHAGARAQHARRKPHRERQPPLPGRAHVEADGREPQRAVDGDGDAERRLADARRAARQQAGRGPRAEADAGEHRPQAPQDQPHARPVEHLPDVGDDGRHHQDGGGLRGRHGEGKQPHRDGRKP